ncbi:MAG: FAD-dependent oxidoreductase, partial [Synergistaceae bacterium]|nr:FAD-dependent oxidoreductase [Synergistaceae bacterium]
MNKRIIVIGGGIAGLSAGIYALKCGFDVTILESHSIAGGNCTSWKRGGYLFEGGMHWLTGSNPKTAVNRAWRHVGALGDSVAVSYPEPFIEYNYKGTPIRFYRDVDTTEQELLRISPEDSGEIKKICNNIRKVNKLSMPLSDIRGVKVTKKNHPPASLLFSGISALRLIRSLVDVSRDEYMLRFAHEGLREAIRSITDDHTGVAPFFLTLGSLAGGDGGFPEGGSLPFVGRIVNTFTGLGGKILYNSRAERVIVQNGKATGVMINGETIPADAVIVTSDTMAAQHLFDTPLNSEWLEEMRATTAPTMAVFICLGIDADLRSYPTYGFYKLEQPMKLAEQKYEFLGVYNYSNNPTYSPIGKTAMTLQLPGDTYDYWKKVREEGRYEAEKQRLGDKVIELLTAHIPEIEGKVEVCNIATPLTYERYCANWKGSWMTEMSKEMKMKTYPAVVGGLNGVYF